MKKLLLFTLCILSMLLLASCGDKPENQNPPGGGDTESNCGYSGYENIAGAPVAGWVDVDVGLKESVKKINFRLPEDWFVIKSGNTIYIFDESGEIGYITIGEIPLENIDRVMEVKEHTLDGMSCSEKIISSQNNEDPAQFNYYRSFTFTYTENSKESSLSLRVFYEELDESSCTKIVSDTYLDDQYIDPYIGTMMLNKTGTKRILIIGNSFISSSKIRIFLNQMLPANDYEIISKFMLSISDGPVDEELEGILGEIGSGIYDAVFMCGFYKDIDIDGFAPFVDACKRTETKLAIFPAHNESKGSDAAAAYPDVQFVDWNGEINRLMEKYGISKWDFCINDYYRHSTALAGYVGAHMIYRSLTGKYPSENTEYSAMSTSNIREFLKSYMINGAAVYVGGEMYTLDPQFPSVPF